MGHTKHPEEKRISIVYTEGTPIPSRDDLTHEIAEIEAIGGTIEEIQLAEDVQRELIAEMVEDAEDSRALQETNIFLLGLKYFNGYIVISKPPGSGVTIVYH